MTGIGGLGGGAQRHQRVQTMPTEQLKKIIAVAVASLFVRSCPARATGTTMATVIAAYAVMITELARICICSGTSPDSAASRPA
ncbi:hypothetical protein [Dactylosporangium sp. NPDC051541]|uniref:hypothetical protein n=1 Tax=Dactylosporangium sp. NPDC051541 TaxID=3363977 RepID=UPI003798A042